MELLTFVFYAAVFAMCFLVFHRMNQDSSEKENPWETFSKKIKVKLEEKEKEKKEKEKKKKSSKDESKKKAQLPSKKIVLGAEGHLKSLSVLGYLEEDEGGRFKRVGSSLQVAKTVVPHRPNQPTTSVVRSEQLSVALGGEMTMTPRQRKGKSRSSSSSSSLHSGTRSD